MGQVAMVQAMVSDEEILGGMGMNALTDYILSLPKDLLSGAFSHAS
jgi:hypothetical protein